MPPRQVTEGGVTDLGNHQELRLVPDADPQRILTELAGKVPVLHFEVAHPSLREIFVRNAREDSA